jgi:hypothetical protein
MGIKAEKKSTVEENKKDNVLHYFPEKVRLSLLGALLVD